MAATDEDVRILIPYKCSSCNADLEFDSSGWAAWQVCPSCKTPASEPQPVSRFQSQVTADSMEFGAVTGSVQSPSIGSSRFDWLDGVVPPRTVQQPAPERIWQDTGLAEIEFEDAESPRLTVQPLPITPPAVSPSSVNPPSAGSVGSSQPSAEMLAAFSRPARVADSGRPAFQYSKNAPGASGGRVFLGIALCVSTIGCLFKLLDNDTMLAMVFGLAAVVSLFLLARPNRRY